MQDQKKSKTSAVDVEVGENLRRVRLSLGMSQEHIALGVGFTFQQMQKYEKGKNRISTVRLCEIADFIGIHPVALLPEKYRNEQTEDFHKNVDLFTEMEKTLREIHDLSRLSNRK